MWADAVFARSRHASRGRIRAGEILEGDGHVYCRGTKTTQWVVLRSSEENVQTGTKKRIRLLNVEGGLVVDTLGERVRSRGRPSRSESLGGRKKLVEMARKIMSLRPRTDIQRREIADVVGVTPALINYYFPDKWSLLEAAAYPIVADLVAAIEQLLASTVSPVQKLKALITVYLIYHKNNGYALEYYINASINLEKQTNIDIIKSCRSKVYDLIRQNTPDTMPQTLDAEIVHSMLWGVCESLGRLQVAQTGSTLGQDGDRAYVETYTPLVLTHFLQGILKAPTSPPEVPNPSSLEAL
ncbi:TetR/AcrR family transcriptional regulator [Methylobacterium sp. WL69]|nr:TetR/AcrR family transcriptional regulator [Methylobacterium sp. WL69]